jgi:hypothetical protein
LDGVDVEQVGSVELLIVGAMATLNATVVALATFGIASELGTHGLEELEGESGNPVWVVSAKLAAPVRLVGDRAIEAHGTKEHGVQRQLEMDISDN